MPAGAVAGWIRGRALLHRRIGPAGARRLAGAGSLREGVAELSTSAYGHDLRSGMDLPAAQRSVDRTLLWTLRILAGWQPPGQSGMVRVLAGRFEIVNTVELLTALEGGERPPPFELGSLSTAWARVRASGSPQAVRAALRRSEWGDPGDGDPGSVLLALELAWARRVFEQVPPAAGWARGAAALIVDRIGATGSGAALTPAMRRDIERVAGRPIRTDGSPPEPSAWTAWWRSVESDARSMSAGQPGPDTMVGILALLAVDARRARAALALAGSPDDHGWKSGVIDAVA